MSRSVSKIIYLAKRAKRVRKGVVLCENCDNPASKSASQALSWTACGPCAWGDAAALDPDDLIAVPKKVAV